MRKEPIEGRKRSATDRATREQRVIALVCVGVLLLLAGLAVALPQPTAFQYFVFRSLVALAGAGFAAVIPGSLTIRFSGWLRAGGSLAVLVLLYLCDPAGRIMRVSDHESGAGQQSVFKDADPNGPNWREPSPKYQNIEKQDEFMETVEQHWEQRPESERAKVRDVDFQRFMRMDPERQWSTIYRVAGMCLDRKEDAYRLYSRTGAADDNLAVEMWETGWRLVGANHYDMIPRTEPNEGRIIIRRNDPRGWNSKEDIRSMRDRLQVSIANEKPDCPASLQGALVWTVKGVVSQPLDKIDADPLDYLGVKTSKL